MTWWWGALIGLGVGVHVATWGAYKDSPFEGFSAGRFVRSIVLAVVAGVVLALMLTIEGPAWPIVLAGLVYATERLLTEYWKVFFRENDQSGFTIPMRMAHRGQVIDSRRVRYLVAGALLVGFVVAVAGVSALQDVVPPLPRLLVVLVAGLGGWLTAVGGAWKDAPVEGFSGWKFLRSPVVATAWAIPLSGLSTSWVLLTIAAAGYAVSSIETYKTFLVRVRPPGKFDGKPIRFHYPALREAMAVGHTAVWLGFGTLVLLGGAGREEWEYPALAVLAFVEAGLVVVQALVRRHTRAPVASTSGEAEPAGATATLGPGVGV